jgi:hypothetical protein
LEVEKKRVLEICTPTLESPKKRGDQKREAWLFGGLETKWVLYMYIIFLFYFILKGLLKDTVSKCFHEYLSGGVRYMLGFYGQTLTPIHDFFFLAECPIFYVINENQD